jgi:rubrerythrin
MEQKELKIETASLARAAMADRQPGEDVDEALLRACKRLYGESSMVAFQALQNTLEALSRGKNIDKETALREIASGAVPLSVVTSTETVTTKQFVGSLDELQPEMKNTAEQTLASGKRSFTVSTSLGNETGANLTESYRCRYCGCEFSSALPSCPTCGRSKKTSFWSRLFPR